MDYKELPSYQLLCAELDILVNLEHMALHMADILKARFCHEFYTYYIGEGQARMRLAESSDPYPDSRSIRIWINDECNLLRNALMPKLATRPSKPGVGFGT